MTQFTPTTEGVRNSYVYSAERHDGSLAAPKEVLVADFDRWLAAHDAETAAKAWDEGFDAGVESGYSALKRNPYRTQQEGTE